MAAAALVSAAACVAAWRAVPWQGRQSALVMAVAMLVVAVSDGGAGVLLGVVLLVSAMLGTVGVRGTPAAPACCHRALVSLVMAVCAFQSATVSTTASTVVSASGASAGHGGHGLTGILSILGMAGVIGVVLWTVVAELFAEPVHRGRVGRLLTIESWAMAAGVVVMCLGF